MRSNYNRLLFLCIASFFLSLNSYSQLSGNAMLAGQSSHAGIKVKFIASSGTAVTDSCLTNAAGHYSVNIAGGLYLVKFSYNGYQDFYYNNSTPLALTNTVILSSTTLTAGSAVYVNGNVSGNWTSNNTYYVQGDLTIPANATLNIQPGTVVKFTGNYMITATGVLNALGNSSSRIVFTTNTANNWNMIYMTSNSHMDFCLVEYCSAGVRAENCSPVISNSVFRKITPSGGIYSLGGAAIIEKNEVYDYALFGIWCEGASTGTISCNSVYNDNYQNSYQNSYGIIAKGDNLVINNNVYNTRLGVWLDNSQSPVIKNNYIHDNQDGASIGSSVGTGPVSQFINNSFTNNTGTAFKRSGYAGATSFINNIVVGSATAINFSGANFTNDHNLYYNNSVNFTTSNPTGAGQVVNNNANGAPIDSYYNVYANPQFVGNHYPFLQPGSSAINAGNTSYNANIGANPDQICYSNLTTGISANTLSDRNFKFFPNPNAGQLTVTAEADHQITIYDPLGKVVFTESFTAGEHQIDLSSAHNGIYFMTVKEGNKIETVKLVKE